MASLPGFEGGGRGLAYCRRGAFHSHHGGVFSSSVYPDPAREPSLCAAAGKAEAWLCVRSYDLRERAGGGGEGGGGGGGGGDGGGGGGEEEEGSSSKKA